MLPVGSVVSNLRWNLASIIDSFYSAKELGEVVLLCHALAISFLKCRLAFRRLPVDLTGLRIGDLGYDCIADLFQRDAEGSPVQLEAYFDGFLIDSTSMGRALTQVRQLARKKGEYRA